MVHFDRMLQVWLVLAVWAAGARAFHWRTDCKVSAWSAWSEPFGFGQVSRERTIIRHPSNNGTECPKEMEEIKFTSKPVTIQSTAKSMVANFMVKNSDGQPPFRDLLVIMDGSGSITSNGFNIAKNEIARLLGMLCPTPDPFIENHQQAAMITFSRYVREIFNFNDNTNTLDVQNDIRGAPYPRGGTCTATAFDYARTKMFTAAKGMRSRPNVKQEVLILTDGQSNCGGDAVKAAKLLDATANVYGLMIGTGSLAGNEELTQYVSSPKNQHLFALEDVRDLQQLVKLVKEHLKPPRNCQAFDTPH